jgi:hypothetical protein
MQYSNVTLPDLIAWQPDRFRIKEFPDVIFEFRVVDGRVIEMKTLESIRRVQLKRK